MQVPGTHVVATDIAGGVAIAFTTGGDVAELRSRVHRMAAMHGGGMGGAKGPGGMMVPSTASSEDIEGGARIMLIPQHPDQLEALRRHVHMHVDRMASGPCPMMEMEP